MRTHISASRTAAWILVLLLGHASAALAQQRGGGFGGGGFGGGGFGGGGNRGGGSSASGRTYYNNGTVGEALISSDPESRRIIVITDEETSGFVSQVITNLDRPKPQVLIKVVFLEVTHNDGSDIGLEGSLSKKLGGSTIGAVSNLFGLTPGVAGSLAAPAGGGIYQVLGNDFQATLRAIASAGKTEILSRPSILTRNNQPATITVGQTLPFITNVRYDSLGGSINTVQYQDIGIILRVTPFITRDNQVEMIVSPEISSLTAKDNWVPISKDVTAPVIAKRAADTVVVTPDGQPVIIGGLMQNNKTKTESKIPILGDIPVLGMAFKRKQTDNTKTELLIFLTPRIVMEPSRLAGLTTSERSNAELVPKAYKEEELDRFLDGVPVKPPEKPVNPDAPVNKPGGGLRPQNPHR